MEDRLTEQTWEDDLDELDRRLRFADRMGGREGIERQHRNGKLTVRERLPLLVDEDSFQQFGKLRGRATYDETGNLIDVLPDGKVDGIGRIGGRKVVITAGDFTVRGGSGESSHGGLGQELSASERALVWRLPLIRLLDSSGGSVRGFENLGRTYLPDGNSFTHWDVSLLNVAPVVSAVMGAAAGIAALQTTLAHWNVMVRDTSQVFPGGPPVVKAALGDDITKEELGGAHIHAYESGVVDNVADSEADACQQIRSFLSYLPSSVDEMAPRGPATPVEDARQDEILTIVPRETRRSLQRPAPRRADRRRGLLLSHRLVLRPGPDHRAGPHQRLSPSGSWPTIPATSGAPPMWRPGSRSAVCSSCAIPSTSRSSISPTNRG